jgi:hypothetical protein
MRNSSTSYTPERATLSPDEPVWAFRSLVATDLQPAATARSPLGGTVSPIHSHRSTDPEDAMTPYNRKITVAVGLALTLAATVPGVASARFDLGPATPPTPPPTRPEVQVVRVAAPSSFDWGSAGIGAAGGIGLSILAVGGGVSIAERSSRSRARAGRAAAAVSGPRKDHR